MSDKKLEEKWQAAYDKHPMARDVEKFAGINNMRPDAVAEFFYRDGFTAGARWAEKHLMEQAASGFNEYEKTIQHHEGYVYIAREAWQAACEYKQKEINALVMKLQARIESLIAGNDKFVEEAKRELAYKDKKIAYLEAECERQLAANRFANHPSDESPSANTINRREA